jgi:hypothetical protein
MSHTKWIHKYQYLKEEIKDLREQEKTNIEKFNGDFEIEPPKESDNTPPNPTEGHPKSKSHDNPGKPLYKILSKILHPDKGGDTDEFAELSIMYREQDTIGLFLKAKELELEVEKYLDEELIDSFETSCGLLEEECDTIKHTISWVWCNAKGDIEKTHHAKWLKDNLGLTFKES